MKKTLVLILPVIALLFFVPSISLNDVFAEKLLVSAGKDVNAQFSFIDKISALESQILDKGANGFLSGITFSPDGSLIASASDESSQGDPGFVNVSFLINNGEPYTVFHDLGFYNFFSCEDISYAPTGELYCSTVNLANNSVELVQIDLDSNQIIIVGQTGLTGTSLGNALDVSSDGLIFLSNQNGLYKLDSSTAANTFVGSWVFPPGLNSCKPATMDFDSSGVLYGSFECQDKFYLAKIDHITAELLSFSPILRDTTLSELPLNMKTEPIVFTPFDFDFLTGSSYGSISSGYDSVTISGTPTDGLDIQSDGNSFVTVCDNTSLSTGVNDRVNVTCNNTTITILSGTVESVFESDFGSMFTASLMMGDSVVFDSELSLITNNGINPILITFDGNPFIINPGETTSINIIEDHYLGYNVKDDSIQRDDVDKNHDKYKKYERFYKYFLENPKSDKYKQFKKYFKYFERYYEKYPHQQDKQITLVDEFEGEAKYNIKKVEKLFNPVDKNNEGISDEESHLVEYKIEKIKDKSKFKGISNIPVTNQFGDLVIDIKSAKTLLVPSSKSHDSVPSELDEIRINHFKCYDAKVSKNTPQFDKRDVNLTDQFGSMTMNVYKETMFCTPVDKNNEGIVNDENYLMCYDLKKIKGEPKFTKVNVFTNNQFGSQKLQAEEAEKLCVPSKILNEPEPGIKISIPINNKSDDAEEGNNSAHNNAITLTSSDLDLTVEAEYVGLRFNDIPLEPRQIVEHAYIQFTSEDKDKGQSKVTIYGHDTIDAPTFTTDNGNISLRLLTSESVMWNIPKWKDEKSGPAQQTPELKSILQEIIDKPGWSHGNSVAFIFTDGIGSDKDAHSFDSSTSKAAVLHIIVSNSEPVPDTTAPVLSLLGSNPQSVIENTPYVEFGATCVDNIDGNISANIIIGGSVNTAILGPHLITYDCADSSGNNAAQVTRTVNVVDGTAPVITLTGDDPVTVNQNTTYVDAGATCSDNGGPLQVTTLGLPVNTAILGPHLITYDCADSSGNNAAQVTRTVNVVDVTAPVITLNGPALVTVNQNTTYVDAGATCSDNTDGNIANIVTNSNVNTALAGTYQVTYDCADSSGNNAAQVTRTVNIAPHPTLSINVLLYDGGSSSFDVNILNYVPLTQSISIGSPFGPANIISGITYTIIPLDTVTGYDPGSIDCAINNNPPQDTSQFVASAGDVVSCTVAYVQESEG